MKLVPPKGLENPSLGTPLQVHKESICIKQPNESNLFQLYMNNVSIDNLFCFRFEKKNLNHRERLIEKQIVTIGHAEKRTNCYHVLGVSENFLAGHLAEVVHLQSAGLLHHVVINIVGPENQMVIRGFKV